jgi:UDP-N-acetylmuramyl pentapeptide phosphotransferase/UDP-N-acetylglucosamine-1-phosphate transferase
LLDHPTDRSLHSTPTPRTGGLAILGSILAGLLAANVTGWTGISFWKTAEPARAEEWLWIMGLTLMVGAVSFWDDRSALPPSVRLGLHGLAAAGAVWGAGLVVQVVPVPFYGDIALGTLAAPLTLLGLMWMTNLYNFMDGMDGFAGGMTVLGFGLLGYLAWAGGAQGLPLPALMIASAAGGFLFFNLPPARIFMGDVGSVPLGFLAGALSVAGVQDRIFDLWVPFLIFSPFVVDATVTLFRRLRRGVKVWQAHREHYYQRLVLAGWGHRKTMVAEYSLMLASGITALLYVHGAEQVRFGLLSLWVIGYIILARGVRAVELKAGNQGTGA